MAEAYAAPVARSVPRRQRRDKTILGVPDFIMKPRIVLLVSVGLLVAFGLLMIYSASSITSLSSSATGYDPAYYLKRQLRFLGIGLVLAVALAVADYRKLASGPVVRVIWGGTILLLLLIFSPTAGQDAYGASRWVSIAGFQFQPSEFAKLSVIMSAAALAQEYFSQGGMDERTFWKRMCIVVGIPLVLILAQPDKGTTIILAATLVVMGYMAGMPRRLMRFLLVLGVVGIVALSLKDDYSRARVMTMLNPWSDPYGDGYQLIQGFYAFGSGGLFGLGIGSSRQKYSYLPMAYNDFIYAVIGEELGLVGTVGMLCGFAAFLWAGFEIARYAPDTCGRLIAAGCTSLIVIQLLVNVCGVIGIMPLTGKPIPFVSYGGSTLLSCLMLVGITVSVSLRSTLPETSADRNRERFRDVGYEADGSGFVGEPTPRSARGALGQEGSSWAPGGAAAAADSASRASAGAQRGFRMYEGGASRVGADAREGRGASSRTSGARGTVPSGRVTTDASGRRRIDLGPDAADRLRAARTTDRSYDNR